jgi:DNA topoisomerase-1
MLPELVDIACPEDGSDMELRNGRFGPFLASVNYPKTNFVLNIDKKGGVKFPAPPPLITDIACPKCSSPMNLRRGKRGPWLGCSAFPKCRGRVAWTTIDEKVQKKLEKELEAHEKQHPQIVVKNRAGKPIAEGTPVQSLLVEGRVAELQIHPEAAKELSKKMGEASKPRARA